jgi:hypothetical protein
MLQEACGKLEFLTNNCLANRRISLTYYTGNMLQKARGKFEFLSNNCSSKKAYFSILLYSQYVSKNLVESLILVKQLFGKKGLFFHTIVQALSRQFLKKIDCGSKLPELKILSDILQAISLQKCIQLQTFFHCFCYINACYQNVEKKSLKNRGNFPPIQSSNILLTHTKRTKMLVHTHIRLKTDNWFIG